MLYMVTFTINIHPMLAYIPYMDPMGWGNGIHISEFGLENFIKKWMHLVHTTPQGSPAVHWKRRGFFWLQNGHPKKTGPIPGFSRVETLRMKCHSQEIDFGCVQSNCYDFTDLNCHEDWGIRMDCWPKTYKSSRCWLNVGHSIELIFWMEVRTIVFCFLFFFWRGATKHLSHSDTFSVYQCLLEHTNLQTIPLVNGCCKHVPHRASPKRWPCCGFRIEFQRTM